MAVVLASKKKNVMVFDKDNDKLEMISKNESPFYEPELNKFLHKSKEFLHISKNIDVTQ